MNLTPTLGELIESLRRLDDLTPYATLTDQEVTCLAHTRMEAWLAARSATVHEATTDLSVK